MPRKALAWLIVPVLGLTELGAHAYFSSRPPAPEEWTAARPSVAALRRKSELIVVAPHWAEPNARAAFGDALMPLADVARADESAYSRAIEVSIIGASAPELRGWKLLEERRAGKLRLRVLENPSPMHPTFDFVDAVPNAAVSDVRKDGESPCPYTTAARRSAGGLHGDPAFPSARHVCSGGEAHFVGVTVVEDAEWRGRRCIWAEPAAGAELTVRYHDVPLGSVLRGYGTLPWWVERELRGTPVEMRILVGGEEVGTYVHRDGEGWRRFEAPLGARAGTRADVEFRISSRRPHDRQFCFQADTR
jgi:hypothetical protein